MNTMVNAKLKIIEKNVDKKKEFDLILNEFANEFTKRMEEIEKDSESYWNSLSKDEQLKAFCAVVRRIHKGDLEDRGSYRYVLYQVFGFGPEAYAPAQMSGYLTIHNALFDSEEARYESKNRQG